MVTSLQLPIASPFRRSSLSSPALNRRSFSKAVCASSKIPMPPLDPDDPFLAKLASIAAKSPEMVNRPYDRGTPPFLDLLHPKAMAVPQVERPVSYSQRRPRTPPPDLPSLLLDRRIVYIGMPLVPAVTELVIAELMYLHWANPNDPIFLYINSTGTTRDGGETVALETEGFAIYDALMMMKTEIHTVAVGAALGQACLLLAAGTKGKRSMSPHSKAMIQQPRMPATGLMASSDVLVRAKEAIVNRDTLVELLAKHTGNSVETVAEAMKGPFYMDCIRAKKFGVIDRIIWRGQEEMMEYFLPPEEWDKDAAIGTV